MYIYKMMPQNHKNTTPLIKSTNEFPVVGIGASAGGLEAFKKFVQAIDADSGMAYVLVQHLDPSHDSMLGPLLQKVSNIPVIEISDDIRVKPNNIYVIPSNKMLEANDGILNLTPRVYNQNRLNLPIDLFFNSLAEVHQSHAIGVVLSGAGSDGTAGLRAIKGYGGITVAQDGATAAFPSMPESAVHDGVADFVLAPEQIPGKILEITSGIRETEGISMNGENDDVFKQIISLIRIRKGTDFTYYKQTTVRRRIVRRIALNKSKTANAYLKFLGENKTEQNLLYQDLLIPVTSFFRDESVFVDLCEKIFPQLIKNKTDEEPFRLWIAGCSTGQEAYSIAICLKEMIGDLNYKIQLFATDLSEKAIAKARSGQYEASEVSNVSPERLQTFFTKTNNGYRVNKEIRELCVFAHHNFLTDPPFSKMDFVSCRNVLIYMEPVLQKKALATFHYALVPKGILLLGTTESTSGVSELFSTAGKNSKLYLKKDVGGKYLHVASYKEINETALKAVTQPEMMRHSYRTLVDDIILSKYTPAGIVVNDAMDIVQFRGVTAPYIEQQHGDPSHSLFKIAKKSLAFELRKILRKVRKENVAVARPHLLVKINEQLCDITIEAIPLNGTPEPYFLVLFHHHGLAAVPVPATEKIATSNGKYDVRDLRITQLETELEQTYEDIRKITQDQEAINEDLQRDNEELLSASEELQSLNEELQTSKEELQSTNEELTSVNHEIQNLSELMTESLAFAEAIIGTIGVPLLVLDKNLRVQKANTAFYETYKLTEEETLGYLVYELDNKQWDSTALRQLLEKVLPEKTSFNNYEIRQHFSNIGDRVMVLNARKITSSVSEKLILLAIEDVTAQRNAEEQRRLTQERFHFIADAIPQKVWTANEAGKFRYFNKSWCDYTGITIEGAEEQGWETLVHAEDLHEFMELWQHSLETGDDFEFTHRFINKDGLYQWHLSRGVAQKNERGEVRMWVGTNTEIEDQVREKELLKNAVVVQTSDLFDANLILAEKNLLLEKLNNELQSYVYISSHDLQEPLRKIQLFVSRILESEYALLSENGKNYFQKINNTARRMQTLIIDLQNFSSSNKIELKRENTNIETILEDVKNVLSEQIQEKNAVIINGPLCEVSINAYQIRQVLQNLISNAIKFSKPGIPPHIVINSQTAHGSDLQRENSELLVKQLATDKKYCHISISDQGIGFDPENKDRIFVVFHRLHSQEQYPGTGIGLAIVKKLVENNKGCITARSVVDKGTIFDIYLPLP